jgi:lipid-A-disaccharide synthase
VTKLCIVTGEASGDLHAAGLLRAFRELRPGVETFGTGGSALAAAGMEIIHPIDEMGVVGLFNVIRHIPMLHRIFRTVEREVAVRRPDAVILVDYPGFNLRLARRCREMNIPVVYYISPQVWAWRRGRVKAIERTVDLMLTILPFEEAFYREHGVAAHYVGNPLVEQLDGIDRRADRSGEVTRLALMPGSRRSEVDSLLPVMLRALELIRKGRKIETSLIKAPTVDIQHLRSHLNTHPEVKVVAAEGRQALADADLALIASGTATLEAALLGVPAIAMYRLSPLTYLLARRLVRLPFFSLVNIVAGKEVIPELLQSEVVPVRIAAAAGRMLEPQNYATIRRELASVREKLVSENASRRAAGEIDRFLRSLEPRSGEGTGRER